jgi:hypothetical protein
MLSVNDGAFPVERILSLEPVTEPLRGKEGGTFAGRIAFADFLHFSFDDDFVAFHRANADGDGIADSVS